MAPYSPLSLPPFVSAQRFRFKTKAQPFDVSLFALSFCSQDAILIFGNICLFFVDFGVHFWDPNLSQNWSKPKNKIWSIVGIPISRVLKLFKYLMRAVLSLLCSSWEPPRLEKYGFTMFYDGKITFFENAAFRYFEALEDLLGRMLALLGSFWLQNGPRNGPGTCPKISKQMVQK